jgi:ATP-dependent Lhr-like helicase
MRRRKTKAGMDAAGRWALTRRGETRPQDAQAKADAIEHVARTLLKRYGVVFWRVLAREAQWLPPWRDLLRVYRRLEGRGEIRGGRFVSGFSGEQFALPDAVGALREIRRRALSEQYISISGSDPLNLSGIVTPGIRVPALTGNRVLYRDGIPIASLIGGKMEFHDELDAESQWQAKKALVQSPSRKAAAPPMPRGIVRNPPSHPAPARQSRERATKGTKARP